MTKKIDWATPVVGKLEVGKTYVDRMGEKHTITHINHSDIRSGCLYGCFSENPEFRHVLDLIAEYTPPAPLKMWMNECDGNSRRFYQSEADAIHEAQYTIGLVRKAVPVTITEGH